MSEQEKKVLEANGVEITAEDTLDLVAGGYHWGCLKNGLFIKVDE